MNLYLKNLRDFFLNPRYLFRVLFPSFQILRVCLKFCSFLNFTFIENMLLDFSIVPSGGGENSCKFLQFSKCYIMFMLFSESYFHTTLELFLNREIMQEKYEFLKGGGGGFVLIFFFGVICRNYLRQT